MEMKVSQRRISGLRAVAAAMTPLPWPPLLASLRLGSMWPGLHRRDAAPEPGRRPARPIRSRSRPTPRRGPRGCCCAPTATSTTRALAPSTSVARVKRRKSAKKSPKKSKKRATKEEPLSQKDEEESRGPGDENLPAPVHDGRRRKTSNARTSMKMSSGELDLLERRRPPPLAPAEDRALLAVERRQDGRSPPLAQKVGFWLDDSQHVETSIGPRAPSTPTNVAPFREFCERYRPNATSLFEGTSLVDGATLYGPPWRSQWVDISNVLLGRILARGGRQPGRARQGNERSNIRAGLLRSTA